MKAVTCYESIDTMLIEDNPGDVELAKIALKRSDFVHRLSIARDGVDALAMLRRETPFGDATRPTLVLLDLNLPKKNGLFVLAAIKADPSLKQIRVVVFTSSQATGDIEQARALGADEFVAKPIDLVQYFAAMNSIGERHAESIGGSARFGGNQETTLKPACTTDPRALMVLNLLITNKLL
jgi:chemotaxis family two-component system response regulator Rcp1